MPSGRIEVPNLDDRTWKGIVEDIFGPNGAAKRFVPEWTDYQPSDAGVALVELFAWIAESIIYRLNKMPEKHYIKLLELLRIFRDPPSPSYAELTFKADSAATIPKTTHVSTEQTEKEEPIVFETEEEKTLTIITEADVQENPDELQPEDVGKYWGKVDAYHVATITREIIGTSDGVTPFQVFALKNAPIYMQDIEIEVDGQIWTLNPEDTFKEGASEEYRLSPVTGEVIFGSHLDTNNPGYGLIPPEGAQIASRRYRYVIGGATGNVPENSLTLLKTPITGVEVTNKEPAIGGSEWELIEDALRRAPQQIKLQNRAVTVADYKFLAREVDTAVGKVACLGPKSKEGPQPIEENGDPCAGFVTEPFKRCPGHVAVLITLNQPFDLNRMDDDVIRKPAPPIPPDPHDPEEPPYLVDRVNNYLEDHKVLTSILTVAVPIFVEINIKADIYYKYGTNNKDLLEKAKQTIARFLHPISGGKHNTGWEIGEALFLPDLFDKLREIPGISYISRLQLGIFDPDTGETEWKNADEIRLAIEEHEIICAAPSGEFKITPEPETK